MFSPAAIRFSPFSINVTFAGFWSALSVGFLWQWLWQLKQSYAVSLATNWLAWIHGHNFYHSIINRLHFNLLTSLPLRFRLRGGVGILHCRYSCIISCNLMLPYVTYSSNIKHFAITDVLSNYDYIKEASPLITPALFGFTIL